MATPIPSTPMDPVRIHPPTAHTTHDQPGKQVPTRTIVCRRARRTHLLHGHERLLIDQRRMHHLTGDHPLLRRRLARCATTEASDRAGSVATSFNGPLNPGPKPAAIRS